MLVTKMRCRRSLQLGRCEMVGATLNPQSKDAAEGLQLSAEEPLRNPGNQEGRRGWKERDKAVVLFFVRSLPGFSSPLASSRLSLSGAFGGTSSTDEPNCSVTTQPLNAV